MFANSLDLPHIFFYRKAFVCLAKILQVQFQLIPMILIEVMSNIDRHSHASLRHRSVS